MKAEVVNSLVTGLKKGGINFIASVPSNGVTDIICGVKDDPAFIHIPMANECDAINVCVGAYLGGKKPAFIGENTGVLLAAYQILNSINHIGGVPILMIVDHQGDYGGPGNARAFGCGFQVPKVLDSFQIYHKVVNEKDMMATEVARAARTAQALRRPAAILISGEEVHAD